MKLQTAICQTLRAIFLISEDWVALGKCPKLLDVIKRSPKEHEPDENHESEIKTCTHSPAME